MIAAKVKLFPLVVLLSFYASTFALYLGLAGIDYPERNSGYLSLYLLLCCGSISLGYYFGVHKAPYFGKRPSVNSARWGFLLWAALLIPTISTYTGQSLSAAVQLALTPSDAYGAMAEKVSESRDERFILIFLRTLSSPLTICVLPVFAFYFFEQRRYRYYFLASCVFMLAMSVFRGTDKEVFDVAIIAFAVWLVVRGGKVHSKRSLTRIVPFKSLLLVALISIMVLSVFSFRKADRLSEMNYFCFQNTNICQNVSYGVSGSAVLGRYLSQGYHGLAVAFDAELSVAGNGLGHSRPLQYLAKKILGVHTDTPLTDQLDHLGWASKGAWSTGIVWLANDVTLIGVPVVLLLLALLLGSSWRQCIEMPDTASLVIFVYLMFTFLYMVGNLQLAQVGDLYIGFLFWLVVYLWRFFGYGRAKT